MSLEQRSAAIVNTLRVGLNIQSVLQCTSHTPSISF